MLAILFLKLTKADEEKDESDDESDSEVDEEFPEVAVLEFDEHAETQSRMWNQFMRTPKVNSSDEQCGSLVVSQRMIKSS